MTSTLRPPTDSPASADDQAMSPAPGGDLDWTPPRKGHWRRDFRFGEWLTAPVTPSFATWFVPVAEQGMADATRVVYGGTIRPPFHVIVHGWYYCNEGGGAGLGGMLVRHPIAMARLFSALPRMMSAPEKLEAAQAEPGLAANDERFAPACRVVVERAAGEVAAADPVALVALIDDLAHATGTLMLGMVTGAGFASKGEAALASFYDKHLRPRIGGSHLPLLTGLVAPAPPPDHGVLSLDWVDPTVGELDRRSRPASGDHGTLIARRAEAEDACRAALAGAPKLLARFDRTLAVAQRWVPVRERLSNDFTMAWPVMRHSLHRLGSAFADGGLIEDPADVFYLERSEVAAAAGAIEGSAHRPGGPDPVGLASRVAARRARRVEQAALAAPLGIGPISMNFKMAEKVIPRYRSEAVEAGDDAPAVVGVPTSPGTATGRVRIVRGFDDFDRVEDGDVLVAPVTAPGWELVMAAACAVVTDAGSAFAHASVIAREYGIPAVVGTGDATSRLVDGQLVTVDGDRGVVVPAD